VRDEPVVEASGVSGAEGSVGDAAGSPQARAKAASKGKTRCGARGDIWWV
jgi:hypothetical protein